MADETTATLIQDGQAFKLRTHKIRIDVVAGPDRGASAELPGPEARVGTAKECALVLKDGAVSRHHLSVRIEGSAIRVIDAGSRNGTILDGLRVHDAYARPDSEIVLGATTLHLRMLDDVVELPLSSRERFGGLLGRSAVMRRLFALLERVAPTDATLLVEGESGTGKELVAEAVHDASARAAGPFIVFDCSAVSATLIESELFGHVRGAFTGAVAATAPAPSSPAERRHPLPRRDRRAPPRSAAQAPPRPRAREVRRVGAKRAQGRRPGHRRHQPRSSSPRGRARPLPRGPLLPPRGDPRPAPAAARAPRRRPPPRASFRGRARPARRRRGPAPRVHGRHLRRPLVAGQRARAAQRRLPRPLTPPRPRR
jgi:hypothetical protein